jgi:hypothetical protein
VSCISQAWQISLKASIAFGSSSHAGEWSSCSSVTLKSSRTKSGLGIPLLHHSALMLFQNSRCAALLLGAYILIGRVFSKSSQISNASAHPGSSSCTVILFGVISNLFITNATPALVHGLSGSADVSMLIFFP